MDDPCIGDQLIDLRHLLMCELTPAFRRWPSGNAVQQKTELEGIVQRCGNVLEELGKTLDKYHELDSSSDPHYLVAGPGLGV